MDEKGTTILCDPRQLQNGEDSQSSAIPHYLIVLTGASSGAMLSMAPGTHLLGRASENQLPLAEASVSRRHAAITVESNGRVLLTDLSSTNGTFHKGQRLTPLRAVTLHDGDRIRLGTTVVLKFACPDPIEERCHREMYERSVRDSLTGLFNRGHFLEQLPLLSERAVVRGLGVALLMLDIDRFKQVNDTLGHTAGDAVLREVGGILRHSTRTEDLVARYGGDEFVAAMPVAVGTVATEWAERIRREISQRRITVSGEPVRLTASIGSAFFPCAHPHTSTALISAADACLYQAKHSGRDRVVSNLPVEQAAPASVSTDDYDFSL